MQIVSNLSTYTPMPCVATIGFFDGVHAGHRYLIEQVKHHAAQQGLCSALITFTVHPRKTIQSDFQPKLLTTQEEKLRLLQDTGVDICFILDFTTDMAQLTAFEFMQCVLKEQCGVNTLLIGHDHRFGRNRSEGFAEYVAFGKQLGIEVLQTEAYFCDGKRISSSYIRNLLSEGNVEFAAIALCYHYFLSGQVVSGYQVGRKIGFPTANLQVDCADKLIPAQGVYAVHVTLADGTIHPGMLNIGRRPTFENDTNQTIEVHLIDFDSDLYNQHLCVSFVKHLRSEMKFDSVEALIAQLQLDEVQAKEALL